MKKLLSIKMSLLITSVCLLTLCACGETAPASDTASIVLPSVEQSSVSRSTPTEENVDIPDTAMAESAGEQHSAETDTLTTASAPDQTATPTLAPTIEPTPDPTTVPTSEPTPTPTMAPTEEPVTTPQPKQETVYVLNTKTMKIHNTWCNSVEKIKPENYKETTESIDELEKQGYVKCKQKGDW